MIMTHMTPNFRRVLALGAIASLVACSPDEILEVEDIDVARPESVQDSVALPAVLAGAIGNFGVTLNGGGDINQIALSGMISDEYINTETFPTRIEVDQRRQQISNGSLGGTFYTIQQARSAADFAADAYRRFAPAAPGLAEALNLSGLTLILMAENYCGAVPLSRETSPGVFEYGPALSTRQLLERAVVKADSALAVVGTGTAAAAVTQARVARIVKARALLNLNQPAAAATAIGGTAGVPSNFQYVYVHSELTGRQNNGTWGLVQNSGRFGVANVEGVNGLPFRSEGDVAGTVRDPRVANQRRPTNNGLGFDGATPMWWQLKYPVRAAPTVIADGVEARLIEAEAAYLAGNYLNALAILNALRSDAGVLTARGYGAALPALPPAVGATAQEDQIFKERAYWLFLTSHRLGDMRRLTRPTTAPATDISGYGRAIESVFPTGVYHKPGTYGTDVNSPIPQAEDNNPEFDRAACVVTKP
jgi:starch-binding outer membrane protein, SusD/RagB family